MRGGAGHLNEQPWGTKEGERQPWRWSAREKKGRAGHGAEAGRCFGAPEEGTPGHGRELYGHGASAGDPGAPALAAVAVGGLLREVEEDRGNRLEKREGEWRLKIFRGGIAK